MNNTSSYPLREGIFIVVLAISSFFLALYLQFEPRTVVGIALFIGSLLAAKYLYNLKIKPKKSELISFLALSVLFDLSLILGYHIIISGGTYAGLVNENYISAYSLLDAAAFILMLPSIFVIAFALYKLIGSPYTSTTFETDLPINMKKTLLLALIPFICWMPYLLIYWPGFIFGDTLSSLAQATGLATYSNHHPFIYTLFIKACLKLGNIIGIGNTGGCVIYCLIQMGFMAFAFSYLSRWITTRCSLKNYWQLIIILIFSLSPYIATYSIAMWKDPIFSTSLVLITILLMDFVLSDGKILNTSRLWLPMFIVLLLIASFSRNNGIYIVGCVLLAIGIFWLIKRRSESIKKYAPRVALSCLCVIICYMTITGPVYKALNVTPSEKAESIGILLNQMARVAALDGDMTESDKEYLNSILPYESYKTVYTPTCTDNLKWNSSFDNEALENDFFKHWFSLLVQNPRVYFESWELQTFGFWAVNQPLPREAENISGGVPRNTTSTYAADLDIYQINAENKLGHDSLRDVFTQDNYSVPISIILWVLIFLSICLCLSGRKSWLIALIPSLALLATLVIASPIWYWPRYGAAVQFLIPFYVALVVLMMKCKSPVKDQDSYGK